MLLIRWGCVSVSKNAIKIPLPWSTIMISNIFLLSVRFFSEWSEKDNLSLFPHIFLFNFIHNECFPYEKQPSLLLSFYTANHFCHSSISLSYIVHFLLPRARFLSVCLITSHVKSGTQMKSKLCTHVSDPEVLRDPVAPSPTPLPLSPSASSARGAEGKRRGGGAAVSRRKFAKSCGNEYSSVTVAWAVARYPGWDAGSSQAVMWSRGSGGEEEHKGPWPIPLPSAVQA